MLDVREIFVQQRKLFAGSAASDAELTIVSGPCLMGRCGFRDDGLAVPPERRIYLSVRLAHAPYENIVGVIRHELGHVADQMPHAVNAGREQRADDIAEYYTGERIRYDAQDVQTIGVGKYPRPLHLHR